MTGLSGCGSDITSAGTLSRITFDRSHGSLWGVQLYIDLTETEIVEARFFPQGESEQTEIRNVLIPTEIWEEAEQTVISLTPFLKEKREKKRIFQKADGTEERTLTLTWETEYGEKAISYDLPSTEEAAGLETFLEELVKGTASDQ